MARFLFCTGGSVGHLAPAVAVARALHSLADDSVIHFLTTDLPSDRSFLEHEGFAFTILPRPRRSFSLTLSLIQGYRRTRALLSHFRPDVFFSKGGSVSVAPAFAAWMQHIPVFLHESDSVSGYANRIVSSIAREVFLGFSPEGPLPAHSIVTGNPVRPTITGGSREIGLRLTGFSGKKPVLLVMGGSQGALSINSAIANLLPELLTLLDVIHITGIDKEGAPPQPGYFRLSFAHEELPHLYAIATLALSRSGAGAITELAACGVPAILVPLRGLAQDHQYSNALRAEAIGGATMLQQETLPATLLPLIRSWLGNDLLLKEKAENMRRLAYPRAAEEVATRLLSCILKHIP